MSRPLTSLSTTRPAIGGTAGSAGTRASGAPPRSLRLLTATCCAVACLGLGALAAGDADLITTGADGLIHCRAPDVDGRFKNAPWPAADEQAFWVRANAAITKRTGTLDARLGGEAEKWSYPTAMLNILGGNRAPALHLLQADDADAKDMQHTLGVDLYWGFTLKGQARKYFYFAPLLDPAYRAKMKEAFRLWTETDPRPTFELIHLLESPEADLRAQGAAMLTQMFSQPFGEDLGKWNAYWKGYADQGWQIYEDFERTHNIRPHPVYGVGTGPVGTVWGPTVRGGIVDARCTDNLRAMRETTVYLAAEEAGNEMTRRIYKEKIRTYVRGLFHTGMGEWDSANYLCHTTAPYLNLYDFAKDPEVTLLAKAACDWLSMAGALKYYRGGYGGPNKRDYGGARMVFGSGACAFNYQWFGDCPIPNPDPENDLVHPITSAYRPPNAVVALARKDFAKPAELWDTKPAYQNWLPGGAERPEYRETLYYGTTFYLGTLDSAGGDGDASDFKLLAWNSQRGADYFCASTVKDFKGKGAKDQIGQYRNLCVWLRPADGKRPYMQVPLSAEIVSEGGVTFLKYEKTWLALRLINLEQSGIAPQAEKKKDAGPAQDGLLKLKSTAQSGFLGFALEVGEEPVSFADFKAAVLAKGRLDLAKLAEGTVTLTGSDGRTLTLIHNPANDYPAVVRDGTPIDWSKRLDLYQPQIGTGPVSLGWKQGTLRIEAGGWIFTETVDAAGKVTFSETKK